MFNFYVEIINCFLGLRSHITDNTVSIIKASTSEILHMHVGLNVKVSVTSAEFQVKQEHVNEFWQTSKHQ